MTRIHLSVVLSVLCVMLCSSCSSSPSTIVISGESHFQLGDRRFALKLPQGFSVARYLPAPAERWPATIEWVRKPWNSGFLTETYFSNVVSACYYSKSEYAALKAQEGKILAPSRFRETSLTFYPDVTEIRLESGRSPVLIRYDVDVGSGVLCLIAEVERYGNEVHERDVEELAHALRLVKRID